VLDPCRADGLGSPGIDDDLVAEFLQPVCYPEGPAARLDADLQSFSIRERLPNRIHVVCELARAHGLPLSVDDVKVAGLLAKIDSTVVYGRSARDGLNQRLYVA
jgi:hypothetical protein